MTNDEIGKTKELVMELCEGNPGAINAMMVLVGARQEHILPRFKKLGIRGSRIYLLCSKKDGGCDLRKLADADVSEIALLTSMLDELESGVFPARLGPRTEAQWNSL